MDSAIDDQERPPDKSLIDSKPKATQDRTLEFLTKDRPVTVKASAKAKGGIELAAHPKKM